MFTALYLLLYCHLLSISHCVDALAIDGISDVSSVLEDQDIALVVATLGRKNADGEEEDLSWLNVSRVRATKEVYVYQRTHSNKPHFINTMNGNECLTYVKYIKDHYYSLPAAAIFVHADANRHCPLIEKVLHTPNHLLLQALHHSDREIRGYIPLSKVFLNHTKYKLEQFMYPMISLSNYIQKEKYKFSLHRMENRPLDSYRSDSLPKDRPAEPRLTADVETINNNEYNSQYCTVEDAFPFLVEYPPFITTYTSASFVVHRENILKFPLHFYELLFRHLFAGNPSSRSGGRTCGYLEYMWTTMWGGPPFSVKPDVDRSCGPLYFTDISTNNGFEFFKSDDGSVERGELPDGYRGVTYQRNSD